MKKSKMQICSVCGYKGKAFKLKSVIGEDLAQAWNLDTTLVDKFNKRESLGCPKCGNTSRTRALATAIIKTIALPGVKNFKDWIIEANKVGLKVAEINSCGQLHSVLCGLNKLSYSEYISQGSWFVKLKHTLKGIPHQDIEDLTYPDSVFDLVLHSEVIEHVNNPQKALAECRRILKSNGVCLFTTPLIKNRISKRRAKIYQKNIIQIETPSFHGSGEADNLVFWEYGGETIQKWKAKVIYEEPDKELFVLAIHVRN